MFIIGITGGTGAGKTVALQTLCSLGALALNCDAIYHELLAGCEAMKSEIDSRFAGVLINGLIDRGLLGKLVFCNPSALLDLNAITHKYISAETWRRLAEWERQGGAVAAVDAIALIESGEGSKCDVVVGIVAPKDIRITRIIERDGITREQAARRINAQKPDSFFKENCQYLLENVYNTAEEFEEKCRVFFKELIGGRTNAG